jgi:predicted phage-related endonuclease
MTAVGEELSPWARWRAQGVGASDVAAIATQKYGGRYAVVAGKLGLGEPVEETAEMARGHAWEQRVADLVQVATGMYVVAEQAWCEHAEHPHRRATVDGFLAPLAECSIDDVIAVLEMKTHGVDVRPPWDYYQAQVQYQMLVTGIPRALLAVATIDDTDDTLVGMRLVWVDADTFHQSLLAELADEAWAHVQARTLPVPDTATALDAVKDVHAVPVSGAPAESASKSDWAAYAAGLGIDTEKLTKPELIAACNDVEHWEIVHLDDELAAKARRHAEIKAALATAKDEADLLEAQLRDVVGAQRVAIADDGTKVAVGARQNILTDQAEADIVAIRPDLEQRGRIRPEAKKDKAIKGLIDSYRQPIGSRRLTISTPKETP